MTDREDHNYQGYLCECGRVSEEAVIEVNSNGTLVNPKTLEYLQSKEFFADIREAMKIKDPIRSEPSQESMDALENYLEEMGVIQLVPLKRLRITRGEVTTGSSME